MVPDTLLYTAALWCFILFINLIYCSYQHFFYEEFYWPPLTSTVSVQMSSYLGQRELSGGI
jgi:hypothetical protein